MFEHKVDDHTTYIICDPDTAAWYNIFWLIGAIIKLCIFVAAALFAPVLILPLWGLNNSRDNTPGRGMGEMFRAHPYQCFFSITSLVSFAVTGVCSRPASYPGAGRSPARCVLGGKAPPSAPCAQPGKMGLCSSLFFFSFLFLLYTVQQMFRFRRDVVCGKVGIPFLCLAKHFLAFFLD